MKKLTSLLLAGIITASITACSEETISNVPLQNTQTPNSISTYSSQGLNSMFAVLLQNMFKISDRNKDNYVNLDEYKSMFPPTLAPNPEPPTAEPPPANDTPSPVPPASTPDQVANQVVAQSQKLSIPTDPTERFRKMDKNKDAKLSYTEVKNASSYFFPNQKESIRLSAKSAFEHMDQNKNKSISKEEFTVANAVGADANNQGTQTLQGMLFLSADKNNNKSLSFSEFEDVYYNALKTIYLPKPPSSQPPAPPSEQPVPPSEPVAPPSEQPAPPQP
jgi:Ca2+-binding EF-hand superfamily protein